MSIPSRLKAYLHFISLSAFIAVSVLPYRSHAQACAIGSARELGGNWYCSEVKAIKYQNFPGNGFYNRVTGMDAVTGRCTTEQHAYSGSLSPLNEELSIHIRGPIRLKRLAVYDTGNASGSSQMRELHEVLDGNHHYHGRKRHVDLHKAHRRKAQHEANKRALGDVVVATIDGQVVSWKNTYAGPSAPSDPPPSQSANAVEVAPAPTTVQNPPESSNDGNAPTSSYTGGSSWNRVAYYDAASVTATGLMFLNHFGGTNDIPGTAAGGPAFGASLSYASSDGKSGAAMAQTLQDKLIEDNVEIVILSDKPCKDSECGYTRPGGVAYHGFGGSRKMFLMEFSMPLSNKKGFNADMPGIWLLNAQIPLTSQYGTNAQCSCWTSGCGEFDLFEVLDAGNFRCKSTIHMAPAGGSSDWFRRPVDDAITAVVVFADEGILVKVLDGSQGFNPAIDDQTVKEWLGEQCSSFDMQV